MPKSNGMAGGRRVTWGDVAVHYFDYGLGDSPAVSCGVAVRLGAALYTRPERGRLRDAGRHAPPRWLDPARRRALLRAAGVSDRDVEAARKRIVDDQRKRIQSLPPLNFLEQLPWFMARSVRRKIRKKLATFAGKRRPPAGLGSPGAQEAVAAAPDVWSARRGLGHEVRTVSRRLGLTGRGSTSTGNLEALVAAENYSSTGNLQGLIGVDSTGNLQTLVGADSTGDLQALVAADSTSDLQALGAADSTGDLQALAAEPPGPRVSFESADAGRVPGTYRGDLDDSARWRRARSSPHPHARGLDDSLHSLDLDGSGHSSGMDHSGHSLGLSGLVNNAMDDSIHAPRHFFFAADSEDEEPPSILLCSFPPPAPDRPFATY